MKKETEHRAHLFNEGNHDDGSGQIIQYSRHEESYQANNPH